MKRNTICCTLGLLISFGLVACNDYDFSQEQYKKEVNLLSNNERIYDRQVMDLTKGQDTLMIVAGLSGSRPSDQAYDVAIMENDSLFNAYNKSNFDIKKDRYARLLDRSFYELPSNMATIPTAASQVKIPLILKNLHLLSPDSVYFVEYKLDTANMGDHINHKKANVLVRIHRENEYASSRDNSTYTYYQSQVIVLSSTPTVRRPTNSLKLYPISGNSVRVLAGDEDHGDYKYAHKQILEKSIVITIGNKRPEDPEGYDVLVSPYHPSVLQMKYDEASKEMTKLEYEPLEVKMLIPIDKYDNTFRIHVDRSPDGTSTYYREFRLHYKYKLSASNDWKEVKAILRKQFNPRAEML